MPTATLTLSSKNYSSWSLRGWLILRFANLDFTEEMVGHDDPANRAELLLLAPSVRVPKLSHGDAVVWDTLAIGEYINEIRPEAGLLPADRVIRAHCRSICGEMHSGFGALRAALPMNLKAYFPNFVIWSRARDDIQRITEIWKDCLQRYGGPFLFGSTPTLADAMYAPVVTRFKTYDVALASECNNYCATMLALPAMQEWLAAANQEPDDIEELEVEF